MANNGFDSPRPSAPPPPAKVGSSAELVTYGLLAQRPIPSFPRAKELTGLKKAIDHVGMSALTEPYQELPVGKPPKLVTKEPEFRS